MTIDELRQAIQELDTLPESAPRFTWLARRIELRKKILKDNPEKFLKWPLISETMFVGNAPYIQEELDYILSGLLFLDKYYVNWDEVIAEPEFGNPELLSDNRLRYGRTSGNFIHQVYHIKTWQNRTNKYVKDLDSIIEFGGGYGTMALICRRLGFKGKYTIIDFPEFNLLQEFYLTNVGIDDIDFEITPTEYYNPIDAKCDLFIGLWSISEVAINWRWELNSIKANSYLFAYAPKWDKMDNQCWFDDFQANRPDYQWHNWKIEHLPNSWYLIGDKSG